MVGVRAPLPRRAGRLALAAAASAVALCPLGRAAAAPVALLDDESIADARAGLEHLYHARTEEAAAAFERIRARHPRSPAPDFLLGGIAWQELTTGPQGWGGESSAEKRFFDRMNAAIALGETKLAKDPADVSARFFVGGAYGYEARYLALQEKWWDAYRTGRKGLKHLERVAKDAPSIEDTYLGLGIYHYYADVIPSVLKVLAGIVGLGGDRARGLEEIRRALRGGQLVRTEAAFFLAEIHTSFEEEQWTALGYAGFLRDEYPENELFLWMHARVLDELYLTGPAAAEWKALRDKPRSTRVRGFLDYRLARTRLESGDFEGAAAELSDLLQRGRLGTRRITMWGRLRYGLALDMLGRHEEALREYALARDLDSSDPARDRAQARLDAGRRDPSVQSLEELAETAAILRGSGCCGEDVLRRVEDRVTGPSRGLAASDARQYFRILGDLAMARLARGETAACEASVGRALGAAQRPPRESRAELLEVRARALVRRGRIKEALADLREARSLAAGRTRDRLDAERALVDRPARSPEPGRGAASIRFEAPDRGEFSLEVEGDFLPAGTRIPLSLVKNRWVGEARFPVPTRVQYRFVADGLERRPDPGATRTVLAGDEAWSQWTPPEPGADQPKQTNPSPSP